MAMSRRNRRGLIVIVAVMIAASLVSVGILLVLPSNSGIDQQVNQTAAGASPSATSSQDPISTVNPSPTVSPTAGTAVNPEPSTATVNCPYVVQARGSCQAVVTITTTSLRQNILAVEFDVQNLTDQPLTDVIIDAEAFQDFNGQTFVNKLGQSDPTPQVIPVGHKRFFLAFKVDGQPAVVTASLFGTPDSTGVYGPGQSNFAHKRL